MKASFISLGLFASLASFVAASPAADASVQLEARQGIICIGCINDDCPAQSDPPHCNSEGKDGFQCNKACFFVGAGCRCCDIGPDETLINCG